MTIIGLPNFLRSEENKTQEMIYHFTAFFSFILLFKPRFDMRSEYGIPTISFVYRKAPNPPDEEFDRREIRYNLRFILATIIGSFMFKVEKDY